MTQSNPRQCAAHEPLYDIHPRSGVSIEVFYSDRTLETFGREGAGWFWWPRRRGFPPNSLARGPFATSYAAYRHAMTAPVRDGLTRSVNADTARTQRFVELRLSG
jgi:hypothetical protein